MKVKISSPFRGLQNRPASQLAGLFFLFFLMVALSVLIDPRAIDITLMPRLLIVLVFLLFFWAFLIGSAGTPAADVSGLWRDPVCLLFGAYSLLTTFSLFVAVNVTAGLTDVFRAWAGLSILLSACLVLVAMPTWPAMITKAGIIAGIVSGLVGYYEFSAKLGLGLHQRNNLLAITGLMSNVNLLASFLLIVFPLCLAGVILLRREWRIAASLVALALLLMLVLLQTRAVYAGLVGGTGLGALLILFNWKRLMLPKWARLMPLACSLGIVAAAALFVFVADGNLIAERVRSVFGDEPTTVGGGRLVIWKLSLQMATDHVLTGIGAGNFPVLLHDYFDIDHPDFSLIHPNWLQPHNDFLWVFVEKGIFGFLLYMGIFVTAFWHLLAALRSDLPRDRLWMAVFVAMGLTGYLVVSFFDFPMERINHQVYLALYLAMAVVLGREARGITAVPHNPPNLRLLRWGGGVVISVLILGIVYATFALRQERFVLLAREAFVEEDWKSTVYYAQRAATPWKTLDPFATPVSYLEGWGHLMLADMPNALACMERARREMPSRAYIHNSLGLVHGMMGNHDKAIACYTEVLRRSPGNPSAMNDLARGYLGAGDARRALEILQEIPPDKRTDAIKSNLARAQRLLGSGQ